jgi:hypothetical protein
VRHKSNNPFEASHGFRRTYKIVLAVNEIMMFEPEVRTGSSSADNTTW